MIDSVCGVGPQARPWLNRAWARLASHTLDSDRVRVNGTGRRVGGHRVQLSYKPPPLRGRGVASS